MTVIDPIYDSGRSPLQCMGLVRLHCSSLAHHIYQALTTLFVQCFLAMRVYRRTFLPFADWVLSLTLFTVSNESWLATGTVVSYVPFETHNLTSQPS
ncbi:hypothetical protein J3R83DRAFT_1616 [Lanmaoa asiatica]|nr:hypothetical protein J3R83DRAFT_1616 [Lanmaoa asiatica]